MEGVGWIGTIIIGGIAGWIAEKVMSSQMGIIGNIALGIVGALLLNLVLLYAFNVVYPGWIAQLIVAAIGACILIFLGRLVRGRLLWILLARVGDHGNVEDVLGVVGRVVDVQTPLDVPGQVGW